MVEYSLDFFKMLDCTLRNLIIVPDLAISLAELQKNLLAVCEGLATAKQET